MFKNRPGNLLVALGIVVMALLGIGTAISIQQVPAGIEANRTAALDWYFAHDHAVLDGDNNVISNETNVHDQWAPLDWYLAHDHAILDGDNNVLSK